MLRLSRIAPRLVAVASLFACNEPNAVPTGGAVAPAAAEVKSAPAAPAVTSIDPKASTIIENAALCHAASLRQVEKLVKRYGKPRADRSTRTMQGLTAFGYPIAHVLYTNGQFSVAIEGGRLPDLIKAADERLGSLLGPDAPTGASRNAGGWTIGVSRWVKEGFYYPIGREKGDASAMIGASNFGGEPEVTCLYLGGSD